MTQFVIATWNSWVPWRVALPSSYALKKYFEYFLPCDDGNFFQSNLSYL